MRERGARKSRKHTVVVLVGGGIDSTVLLSIYRREKVPIIGVHYDYGQKALRGELRSIRRVSHFYKVPMRWRRLTIPVHARGDEYLGRNALFILAAAAEFGISSVRIGIGAHARSPYYDFSRHFFDSMQGVLDGYFDGKVVLEAPLISFSKAEVVAYGRRHRVPLDVTFSCTRGTSLPCGLCPSCLDRRVLGV